MEFAVKAEDSAAFAEFLLKFVDGNAERVGTGSTKFVCGEGFVILYVVRNGSVRMKDVKVKRETESTYIHVVDAKKGDTSKAVDISFGKQVLCFGDAPREGVADFTCHSVWCSPKGNVAERTSETEVEDETGRGLK